MVWRMACRAARCTALRGLPLGSAVPVVSTTSFPPSLRISRSSCRCPRAFKFQIRGTRTNSKSVPETQQREDEFSSRKWKIKMLYDGECPLCMREVNMLKERNKLYGAIKFVDISSKDYSPKDNQGLDYRTVMGKIHAILSDGTVVTNVEAFRRLYEEVGLGWVYAITKYEPMEPYRLRLGTYGQREMQDAIMRLSPGRPPLEDVLKLRKERMVCNDDKVCKM